MSHLELSLLGPFRAALDGEPVAGFESNKVRALLAYLAVEGDRAHPRGALAGLLWPDWPERSARKNLSNALTNLRAAVGDRQATGDRDATPPHLLVTRETIQFNRASDCWLDVETFAQKAQVAAPGPAAAAQLEEAVALYGGEFLEGFSVADSPAFEEWALLVRERLHRQALEALGWLAEHHARREEYERACGYARRQVELEPSEEGAHRELMRLYAWSGQRAAALRQYRECVRVLEEELGVPPARETVELYERIGEERELAPPGGRPAGRPVPRTAAPRHNLPAQLIPFVGRAGALAEIVARLRDPGCRLLTLVGPGGSGKTRLAIEAARRVLDDGSEGYPDGVHFVPLAPLRSPDEMPSAVAQAIGLSGAEGMDPREQLLEYLRDRRALLVLDNLEHLLGEHLLDARLSARPEGGGDAVRREGAAELIAQVLQSAPEVKVLATSRARLNVPGEELYPVRGMGVPPPSFPLDSSPADLSRYSAAQLFLQSARRVCPDFQPAVDDLAQIAQVCRLAGGMPLAILLAAAWLRMLSPAEIAAEISGRLGRGLDLLAADWHGVPERQRSMRAVFDHSYDLLSERQRQVLQGLSVFRGSLTREGAGEVAGASLRELLALVDASLLQRTSTGRYELHELLRQYAAEKLDAVPGRARAARDRHAAYYAAAMERWGEEHQGPRQWAAMTELREEIVDVRAAWAWMVERGQAEWLGRALEGVFCLWVELRRFDDAEGIYLAAEQGLAPVVVGSPAPALQLRVLSRVLAGHSLLLYWERHDYGGARDLVERSLALLERPELEGQDVRRERAFAWLVRAEGGIDLEYEEAAALCRRSVALYRELGERWWTAHALNRWSRAAGRYGEWEEAKRLCEQSDALYRELGLEVSRTHTLWSLSWAAMALGQFEAAERLARENLAIRQGLSQEDAGMGYAYLGRTLYCLGRFAEARTALGKGIAVRHRLGLRWRRMSLTVEWIAAGVHMGRYEQARQQCRAHVQECRRLGAAVLTARALALGGWIDLATGCYDRAWRLAQEALALVPEWHLGENLVWDLSVLSVSGYAARGLGGPDRAHPYFRQALRAAADTKSVPNILQALPGAALLLADQGQGEHAVELYALCCRYPYVANSRWFEDVVGQHIDAAAATLPEDVVAAARERGRARDLWATVRELLAE